MILLDTDLLIYAHRSAVPQHAAARRAIEEACGEARGAGVALATVAEFFSVVTHARAAGRPSTPQEAGHFIEGLTRGGDVRLLVPKARAADRLLRLAQDLEVSGPRIFDLQIALTGLDHGARQVWTHDGDFVRVPGLAVVDPL